MKWSMLVVVLVTVNDFVRAEDETSDKDVLQGNHSTIKKYNEGWRAVEVIPEGASGWIPHEQHQEQHIPKRRRLRKRKRKPQTETTSTTAYEDRPLRQRIQLQPWEEFADDIARKPNVRRKVAPPYQLSTELKENLPTNEEVDTEITHTRRVEDTMPLEATIYVQSENSRPDSISTSISDIKNLLKKSSGSLSLSEILQQQNLSLAELLSGNEKAISALTQKPLVITESIKEETTTDPTTKYKRLPPSIGLKKNASRTYEQDSESAEMLSTKELIEAQRRRLSLLHNHKENRLFSEVTKYDVVTEAITERRIFVPSHPKYYTSLSYKPLLSSLVEQSTEPIFQTIVIEEKTTEVPRKERPTNMMYLKPKLKITSPSTTTKTTTKELKNTNIIEDEDEGENYPVSFNFSTPIKLKISEIIALKANKKTEKVYAATEAVTEQSTQTTSRHETMSSTIVTSTEVSPRITAKEEIDEILKDAQSREKLSRILENINMTIDELVEQRERGSSQLHLADIFHNRTKEPEPREAPFVGKISKESFSSYPVFNRKQKSQTFRDSTTNQYVSILNVQSTERSKNIEAITTVNKEPSHFSFDKSDKHSVNTFQWKKKYPDLFPEFLNHDNREIVTTKPLATNYDDDIQRLEEIDNKFALASNEQFDAELQHQDTHLFMKIPTGVKSAVIVSFAIIGLSILVFLTILIIFKWSQKHRRKLNYCSSLSSRMKSPIMLQGNATGAIRSFMNETLGRKKNYYKSNIHSMCDDIWECERNKKQQF